ncbi:MAG: type II toxin-antitoxin system VapC family toxin [Rhodanobacteraceae bacterium]
MLDNSVTMRWCFGDGSPEDLDYAAAVSRQLQTDTALVPAIWALEVVNVVTRAESLGQLEADTSGAFLAVLQDMRIVADPDTGRYAFNATMDLARRHHLSAYDAAYLELAQRKQIPLATLDTDLRKAASTAGVSLF